MNYFTSILLLFATISVLFCVSTCYDFVPENLTTDVARHSFAHAVVGNTIYMIGGNTGDGYSSQIYSMDATASPVTWTEVTPVSGVLPVLVSATAVEYDGKIYIYGGFSSMGSIDELFKYDPVTNSITNMTASGAKRAGHCAVTYGGAMYTFGGFNIYGSATNDVFKYTFATDAWSAVTTTGTDPVQAGCRSCVVHEDIMIVAGGYNSVTAISYAYKLDLNTVTWTMLSNMPSYLYGHSAIIDNGVMTVYGGKRNEWYAISRDLLQYVVSTDTWVNATLRLDNGDGTWSIPPKSYLHGADVIDGVMFVYYGLDVNWTSVIVNTMYKMNLASSAVFNIVQAAGTSTPTDRFMAAGAVIGDNIYVIGGRDAAFEDFRDIHMFNTVSKEWTKLNTALNTMPKRFDARAAAIGDDIYIIGGKLGSSPYKYNTVSTVLTMVNGTNEPTFYASHCVVAWNGKIIAFGGLNSLGYYYNYVDVFDTASSEWSRPVTGASPSVRVGHTCVIVDNEMIVYGGRTSDTTYYTGNVDKLNLNTWTWSSASATTMPPVRAYHSAVVHAGIMTVYGGITTDNVMLAGNPWTYDVANNEWTEVPTLNTPTIYGHYAANIDGVMYNMYGFGEVESSPINSIHSFELCQSFHRATTNESCGDCLPGWWSSAGTCTAWTLTCATGSFSLSPPTATADRVCSQFVEFNDSPTNPIIIYPAEVAIGNNLYMLCGASNNWAPLNTVYTMDVTATTPAWSLVTPSGTALPYVEGSTVVAYDGKIFHYGGRQNGVPRGYVDKFDPVTNTVTRVLTSGVTKGHHCAVQYNGTMYAFGGFLTSSVTSYTNTLVRFDLTTNQMDTITATGDIPSARYVHSCVIHETEDEAYMIMFGGIDASGYTNDLYKLALHTGTFEWTNLNDASGPVPSPREGHIAVMHNDVMIVHGGWDLSTYLNGIYQYHVAANSWTYIPATDSMPVRGFHNAAVIDNKLYMWYGQNKVNGDVTRQIDMYELDLE